METVIGILKKHGLYTDEFRTRMDILEAVSKGKWDDPTLKTNFTPEQIADMQRPPPAQGGGLAELSKKAMDKAAAVAASDSAQRAADYARGVATSTFSSASSSGSFLPPAITIGTGQQLVIVSNSSSVW